MIPNPEKTEVLVIRISKKTKSKLNELAKASQFDGNNSAVVRHLIESEYTRI